MTRFHCTSHFTVLFFSFMECFVRAAGDSTAHPFGLNVLKAVVTLKQGLPVTWQGGIALHETEVNLPADKESPVASVRNQFTVASHRQVVVCRECHVYVYHKYSIECFFANHSRHETHFPIVKVIC